MWTWLEKIIGTYEKPLRLTKDMEVKSKKKKTKKKITFSSLQLHNCKSKWILSNAKTLHLPRRT